MRIGLNSGPVIVGSIGDDLRMDYTAMGDTTNLASRLESLAQPGTALLSANTHRMAQDFFEFKPLGGLEVKGKAEAQEAYELIRVTDVATRIEAAAAKGLTTFVGRSREIQVLKEAYEKVKSGNGQVVGIVGEAGVGKSRILLELRNGLPTGEYTYLEGRCLHYGGGMVYLPILDILRSYLAIEEGDREFIIKKKLQGKLLQLNERFKIQLPPFQELLSLKIDDEKYPQLDHGQKKMRIFEGLRDVLVSASQDKPLVMALEDLHWIDKTSEEFLSYLIDWIANSRILIILLYRPEYTHQWGSKSYYSKVGIDQLSAKTSAELVQVILEDGAVGPELKDLILGRASGNPLYVEELTQSLLENGTIQKKDHEYVLARTPSEILVPDSIQGIIAARLDRVEEDLKRIMQVASVIGREFAFRILQTIMGMRAELKSQLLNLQGLEFISEKRLFPELEYIFKHALTQEVAYSSLLQKRKKEIHEKIGAAIETLYPDRLEEYYELLAHHYSRSDNQDKAFEYLDLANQKVAKLNAMEDAMAYFDDAMKILDSLPETKTNQERRIILLENQVIVFLLLGKFPEYYDLLMRFEPMAIGLEDQSLRGAHYARMGHCEEWFGELDKGIQTEKKALTLCKDAGSLEDAGYACNILQWCYYYKADYGQVLSLKKEALQLLEPQFNLRWYVRTLCIVSLTYWQLGCWNKSIEEAKKALEAAEKFGDNSLVSFAAMVLSIPYSQKGEIDQGIEYGMMAVERAPTPADKAFAEPALAFAFIRDGKFKKPIEILEAMLPVYHAMRFIPEEVGYGVALGEAYLLAGTHEKAQQVLKGCIELAERYDIKCWTYSAFRILGEVALKTDPAQAAEYFEKSIGISQEVKAENELALTYADYGRYHKQKGDIVQAQEYLIKALKIFERLGTLIEPEKIRKELAELPET
jgi:tetratricopeptide (TPR) repeat protein